MKQAHSGRFSIGAGYGDDLHLCAWLFKKLRSNLPQCFGGIVHQDVTHSFRKFLGHALTNHGDGAVFDGLADV